MENDKPFISTDNIDTYILSLSQGQVRSLSDETLEKICSEIKTNTIFPKRKTERLDNVYKILIYQMEIMARNIIHAPDNENIDINQLIVERDNKKGSLKLTLLHFAAYLAYYHNPQYLNRLCSLPDNKWQEVQLSNPVFETTLLTAALGLLRDKALPKLLEKIFRNVPTINITSAEHLSKESQDELACYLQCYSEYCRANKELVETGNIEELKKITSGYCYGEALFTLWNHSFVNIRKFALEATKTENDSNKSLEKAGEKWLLYFSKESIKNLFRLLDYEARNGKTMGNEHALKSSVQEYCEMYYKKETEQEEISCSIKNGIVKIIDNLLKASGNSYNNCGLFLKNAEMQIKMMYGSVALKEQVKELTKTNERNTKQHQQKITKLTNKINALEKKLEQNNHKGAEQEPQSSGNNHPFSMFPGNSSKY